MGGHLCGRQEPQTGGLKDTKQKNDEEEIFPKTVGMLIIV
jgi:hypothetical protein